MCRTNTILYLVSGLRMEGIVLVKSRHRQIICSRISWLCGLSLVKQGDSISVTFICSRISWLYGLSLVKQGDWNSVTFICSRLSWLYGLSLVKQGDSISVTCICSRISWLYGRSLVKQGDSISSVCLTLSSVLTLRPLQSVWYNTCGLKMFVCSQCSVCYITSPIAFSRQTSRCVTASKHKFWSGYVLHLYLYFYQH